MTTADTSTPTISGKCHPTQVTEFDYGQLDGATWKFVQDARDDIRRLGKQTVESIVEIGRLWPK